MASSGIYNAWVILYPAPDVSGAWIAHALDFDVVTQGNGAEDAYKMAVEAICMVLEHDLQEGVDPYARRAPEECWRQLLDVLEHGERLGRPEFFTRLREPKDFLFFAVQMVFWPREETAVVVPNRYDAPLALGSPASAAHAC
jgi:hypothetical protein